MKLMAHSFGCTSAGKDTVLIRLENTKGMYAEFCNYGAVLVSLGVPDKNGDVKDVVLGFDNVSGYEKTRYFMGATIGRHAGQIKDGSFKLGDQVYTLVRNDQGHTMHGGTDGFNKQVFRWRAGGDTVEFLYHSPDGDAGFPGNMDVAASYRLSEENELTVEYSAHCDCDTVLNMTNHSYFNLSGGKTIINHLLRINADEYTEIDRQGLPTGKILPVKDTPYDFLNFRRIGNSIDCGDQQLIWAKGYDHNWVINRKNDGEVRLACELTDEQRLRTMLLYTNQPGLQMYSGNYMDELEQGKGGIAYSFRNALCLEPQLFHNGLEHPLFPSPVLKKGERYYFISRYKFI